MERSKDEAIPALLASENKPTFVTINLLDFWKVVPASNRYCVVCFSLQESKIDEIPLLLRRLLRMPEFKTRQSRMGKMIRIGFDAGVTIVEVYDRGTQPNRPSTSILS